MTDYFEYMTVKELRDVYRANDDVDPATRNEILEILVERFTYDGPYYGVTGDPREHAISFLGREGADSILEIPDALIAEFMLETCD